MCYLVSAIHRQQTSLLPTHILFATSPRNDASKQIGGSLIDDCSRVWVVYACICKRFMTFL